MLNHWGGATVIPVKIIKSSGRGVMRAFSALVITSCTAAAYGDARLMLWEDFMAPVRSICYGEVIEAREIGVVVEHLPLDVPEGTIVGGLLERDQMVSVLETSRSLAGHCPERFQLRWERPIPHPAYYLPLDDVGSWFVVYLGKPIGQAPQLLVFEVSPRYAWQRQFGSLDGEGSIAYYEPQHLQVPAALWSSHLLRTYFPGGHVASYQRVVEEKTLFEHLRTSLVRNSDGGTSDESPRRQAFRGIFIPQPDARFCSEGHHVEWWSDCLVALLARSSEGEDHSGSRRLSTPPVEDLAQGNDLVDRWVDRCAQRIGGGEENKFIAPAVARHDHETCFCSREEHIAWLRHCVSDVRSIIPGMQRWQVQEVLVLDGGIHTPARSRLVHPRCYGLKVDVEFANTPGSGFDPDDLATAVTPPYLEQQFSD